PHCLNQSRRSNLRMQQIERSDPSKLAAIFSVYTKVLSRVATKEDRGSTIGYCELRDFLEAHFDLRLPAGSYNKCRTLRVAENDNGFARITGAKQLFEFRERVHD